MTRRFSGLHKEGTGVDDREPVRYIGYDPQADETHYAVVSGYTDLPPVPFARLIAAAPDLLDALESLLKGIDEYWQTQPEGINAIKKTFAAIDKAREA